MKNYKALFPTLTSEELESQIPYIYLVGYSDSYELDSTIKNNERMIDLHEWFVENEPEHANLIIEQLMTKDLIDQIVKNIPRTNRMFNDIVEPIFIMSKKQSWLELSNCNLEADFYINGIDETSNSLIMRTWDVIPQNYELNHG